MPEPDRIPESVIKSTVIYRSPESLVIMSLICIQVGSAVAFRLFPVFGPLGVLFLRVTFAGLLLVLLGLGASWLALRQKPGSILLFGLSMAIQNGCFLNAIARIPLGIAVSISFLGPLGMSLASSQKPADLAWTLLAAAGIALLTPDIGAHLDRLGVALALVSALGWAGFIHLSRKVGSAGTGALAPSMIACGLLLAPFGAPGAIAGTIAHPEALLVAVAMAVFASAVPMSLEYRALTMLPPHRYGVIVSLEPVVASLVGLVILGERIAPRGWIAIAFITAASLGMTLTGVLARRRANGTGI